MLVVDLHEGSAGGSAGGVVDGGRCCGDGPDLVAAAPAAGAGCRGDDGQQSRAVTRGKVPPGEADPPEATEPLVVVVVVVVVVVGFL